MRLKEAILFVRQHATSILKDPRNNVTGLAVGTKDGRPLGDAQDFAVTAFVPEKLSKRQLSRDDIRGFGEVCASAAGRKSFLPTDINIVESGSAFRAHAVGGAYNPGLSVPAAHRGVYGGAPASLDTQKSFSARRIGVGITNPAVTKSPEPYPSGLSVGTIGFFLKDAEERYYLVSNNHVLAGGSGVAPARPAASSGDPVCHPGTLDFTATELAAHPTLTLLGGSRMAELSGWVPLRFSTSTSIPLNQVDLAIARLISVADPDELHRLAYGGSILSIAPPYLEEEDEDAQLALNGSSAVYKVGRTTGYTEGEVVGVAGAAMIAYPGGHAQFVDQLVIRPTSDNTGPFSSPGDSGASILNNRHELSGLLFAGSTLQTLANPISIVLSEIARLVPQPEVILAR